MNTGLKFVAPFVIATTLGLLANSALAETPTFNGYPAPGGTTASGVGSVGQAGGRTWSYSNFNPTSYGSLYYTIGATVNSVFNANSPAFTADGSTDYLTFNSALSNLSAGIAIWSGTTNVPLAIGGNRLLYTEFKLTTKDASNNPLSLSNASAYGLPGVGAALKVEGNFKATWEFLASTNGSSFAAALPVYDSLQYKVAGNIVQSNVGGAFYSTAPVPEPETYAMFLAGLGLMGGAARRRKQK